MPRFKKGQCNVFCQTMKLSKGLGAGCRKAALRAVAAGSSPREAVASCGGAASSVQGLGDGGLVPDLRVHANRWRDGFGNTYHRAYIYSGGRLIGTTPITYGYDRQYIQTAREWLREHGYADPGQRIDGEHSDVRRKRDL